MSHNIDNVSTISSTIPTEVVDDYLLVPQNDPDRPAVYASGDLYTFLATTRETDFDFNIFDFFVPVSGGPPAHVHTFEHEVWFVEEGKFQFNLGNQGADSIILPENSLVFGPRDRTHSSRNLDSTASVAGVTSGARTFVMTTPGALDLFFETVSTQVVDRNAPIPSFADSTDEGFISLLEQAKFAARTDTRVLFVELGLPPNYEPPEEVLDYVVVLPEGAEEAEVKEALALSELDGFSIWTTDDQIELPQRPVFTGSSGIEYTSLLTLEETGNEFSYNQFFLEPEASETNADIFPDSIISENHELFYVNQGELSLKIEDEVKIAEENTFVYIPPGNEYSIANFGDETVDSLSVSVVDLASPWPTADELFPSPLNPQENLSVNDNDIPNFTRNTVDVNGTRLNYVIGGEGPPVVLLHGWPQTWFEWKDIMPKLAEQYTVIAPDLPGLGDSSTTPDSEYDKLSLAEDIYQLVDYLDYEEVALIGHDLGGWIAYAYANEYPENVSHLGILEAPIPGLAGWDELLENPALWHFDFYSTPEVPETLISGNEQFYLSYFFENFSTSPKAFSEDEIDEYVDAYSNPDSLHAAFEYYRALPEDVRQNQEYAKTELQMPVLALGGSDSLGDFPLQQLQEVASNVSGGTIENCGHYLPDECPEILSEELLNFLGDTDDILFLSDEADFFDSTDSDNSRRIYGGEGNDEFLVNTESRVFGEDGEDILDATLGSGRNLLDGGNNNDILLAGSSDQLVGGEGDDLLYINQGSNNLLYGGSGNDQFKIVNSKLPNTIEVQYPEDISSLLPENLSLPDLVDTKNTIMDFELGIDQIHITGIEGVSSFDDLQLLPAFGDLGSTSIVASFTEDGVEKEISLANVAGVIFNELSANDFVFA